MDPHDIQNNLNITGHQPNNMINTTGQAQYNPMLLPPQYMNQFPFYSQNPMLMDQFQQQQNYFMSQQMQPMFQQQQMLNPQLLAQHPQIQQAHTTTQQRFLPTPQQQQQAALHEQQQRLLDEQRKQLEAQRMEQMALQRAKEAKEREEEQKRQRELLAQQERQQRELLRREEEAQRLLEEQRKKEEAERIEREKLLKIREDQLKKQRDNEQSQREIADRITQVANPLSLVATHFINKYTNILPFPSENLTNSTLPCVCDVDQKNPLLDSVDPNVVSMISTALSRVDVNDIRTRLEVHGEMAESNDLLMDQLPPLIRQVIDFSCNALDVEPEHNMSFNDTEHLLNDMDVLDGQGHSRVLDAPLGPSTSTAVHPAPEKEPPKVRIQLDQAEVMKRRQMATVGKQPKAGTQRKKKDMVESLYDSLTDYFDPNQGRRRRHRTKTLEDDQADQHDLDLIAKMEAEEAAKADADMPSEAGSDDENKFYDKKKKRKREEVEERPRTPTEVIRERELEWNERQRKKMEKRRRRKVEDSTQDLWNNDVMAENDSFTRFLALLDQVLDQVGDMDVLLACNGKTDDDEDEDDDVSSELLIDKAVLDEMRNEAQKLKSWKKLNKVSADRLVKLISMLERNMRDVISQDGSRLLVPVCIEENNEEDDAALRELVYDRLIRAVDAACTVMLLMTSYKMPKQVFIEDAIDRAINLSKQYLNHIIFPSSDSMFRNSNNKKKVEDTKRKRRAGTSNRTQSVQVIYGRIADLIGCFAELVRLQNLTETSIHHLATMSISSFFVSNVGEIQLQAMCLASNIFAMSDDSIRISMLNDILNSLHRLPPGKNTNNSYRIGPEQWISNTTVLVLQLLMSVAKVPKRKKHDEDNDDTEMGPDTVVKESFRDVQRLTTMFLNGFLAKCSCKGNKSEGEEDYRRLFDGFLQDLLLTLYKPEWPVAENTLTVLGTLLVKHYRNYNAKTTDIVIRQACLDYLGCIAARLRKDTKSAIEDSEKRLEVVVKTLIFDDEDEQQFESVEDVDISEFSQTDKLKKLEQALIDYLIEKKGDDVNIEYAIKFYAGEWYKETAEDLDMAKQKFKTEKNGDLSEKDRRKLEKKMERMNEKGSAMKEFLLKLVDRKHIRKRAEHIKRTGNIMLDSDAAWTVKYLASRREFSHSFDIYLRHILYGVTVESTVSLRTKAMKCLTQIIEADHSVLGMHDVRSAVNSRMMDPNAAVREATIELLGKFLLVKEEFIQPYYNILLERIKDSGTAVRKRVIRIMREICERFPSYDKIPDMLSKLIRRVVDEDGVKKLVQETFTVLWFHPISEKTPALLLKKVIQMTSVAQVCAAENTSDFLEQLLQAILKQADKSMVLASRQIVDSLVDSVLILENKMASDVNVAAAASSEDLSVAQLQKANQERLLASLTTLSIFSKVRPELLVKHAETLQPYLAMNASTAPEQSVLNEVICMLERVIPLMKHPSDEFLQSMDTSLANLLMSSVMTIVVSVVACSAAVFNNFPRNQTAMAQKFLYILKNLNSIKDQYANNPKYVLSPQVNPLVQRSVFSIGLLARYFDFDALLGNDQEALKVLRVVVLPPNKSAGAHMTEKLEESDEPESRKFRDNVFSLLSFFSTSQIGGIRVKAITAIGHLCAKYAEYLARDEVTNMYNTVLASPENNFLQLKIQALKNLELFLLAEERKMIKSNEEWEQGKEQQNLKEMELAGSGLSSAVIQIYWNNVLNCYFHLNEVVRQSAVQVTWLTLSQGLVTPGSSIPALIAMTTDPLVSIRNKVENLLKDIDNKYAGMVQSKAISGIRVAFKLHSLLRSGPGSVIRGIRMCEASFLAGSSRTNKDPFALPRYTNDGQAILSGLYSSLRGNRSHRRSFLNSVLRLFSEDCREKLQLPEWVFVADNVAMFPYQVLDEPLYAIRMIDGIISMSGQTIVNHFKERLGIKDDQSQPEDDDTLFEPEYLYRRFPENKSELYELMLNSQACFILLYLKNFLIKLYGFTEAKVQEYSPSESAKVYEKAVTRKNIQMFHPQSALQELKTEVIMQRNTPQGDFLLAQKICSFRKMLLSLDRAEDDADENEEGVTTGVTEKEDEDIDGETDGDVPSEGGQPMDED